MKGDRARKNLRACLKNSSSRGNEALISSKTARLSEYLSLVTSAATSMKDFSDTLLGRIYCIFPPGGVRKGLDRHSSRRCHAGAVTAPRVDHDSPDAQIPCRGGLVRRRRSGGPRQSHRSPDPTHQ